MYTCWMNSQYIKMTTPCFSIFFSCVCFVEVMKHFGSLVLLLNLPLTTGHSLMVLLSRCRFFPSATHTQRGFLIGGKQGASSDNGEGLCVLPDTSPLWGVHNVTLSCLLPQRNTNHYCAMIMLIGVLCLLRPSWTKWGGYGWAGVIRLVLPHWDSTGQCQIQTIVMWHW